MAELKSHSQLRQLEKFARRNIPHWIGPSLYVLIAWPRYWYQKYSIQKHTKKGIGLIFVVGIPKSGSTWVKRMISHLTGYSEIMIPEAVIHSHLNYESHSHPLPSNTFKRLAKVNAVLKMHIWASQHNIDIIKSDRRKVVVITRDLRDIAVSYIFYVQRTSYHSDHRNFRGKSINESLDFFIQHRLEDYVIWVESWKQYAHEPWCKIYDYSDLLEDTNKVLSEIVAFYSIPANQQQIEKTVAEHSFSSMAKKDDAGKDPTSFYRKGVAGDWESHFTEELHHQFQEKVKDVQSRLDLKRL